jgi:hypothetical protein
VTGGFDISIGSARISSHNVRRPVAIAVVALALAIRLFPHRERQIARVWQALRLRVPHAVAATAITIFCLGVVFGVDTAGGADYYGYVSQAALWARGNPVVAQPLSAPWPLADWSFAPLGYRPGPTAGTIVPTYPPGFPLIMAPFHALGGERAVYLVVPALGALAVWMTFLLGRRIDDETTGACAALLLATSPAFLFHVMTPMSDVPVAAWWLAAFTLAFGSAPWSAPASGLAASAAVLTRPNVAPLALAIAAWLLIDPRRSRSARIRAVALFVAGMVPGIAAVAAIHTWLYGSPLESGYGRIETIFAIDRLGTNVVRYFGWMFETQTPLILAGLAAPWMAGRAPERGIARRRHTWILLGAFVILFGCYAFYLPFDNWTYLRFLLPALPLLLILAVMVARAGIQHATPRWRPLLIIGLTAIVAAAYWDTAVVRGVFGMRGEQRRFRGVAEFVEAALPARAALITRAYSGSVRHYANRLTVRWDYIPAEWLDRAAIFLRDQGYQPYLIIEQDEETEFAGRFAGAAAMADLKEPPVFSQDDAFRARIFELHPGGTPPVR